MPKKNTKTPMNPKAPMIYDANLQALRDDLHSAQGNVPPSIAEAGLTLLHGLRDSLAVLLERAAERHPEVVPPPIAPTVQPRLVREYANSSDDVGTWWIVLHPLASASRGHAVKPGPVEVALRISERTNPEEPVEIRVRAFSFEKLLLGAGALPTVLPGMLDLPNLAEGFDAMLATMPTSTHGLPN